MKVKCFQYVFLFFFVIIPSLIYTIVSWLFIPLGWLILLVIGSRPVFSYKAAMIAYKLSTIFVLLIIPALLFIFTWKPLGIIIFFWFVIYLSIRIYSGVDEREKIVIDAVKHLESLEFRSATVRYNKVIFPIMVLLSIASPLVGYYLGNNKGLWIGVAISAVAWILSSYAKEIVVTK